MIVDRNGPAFLEGYSVVCPSTTQCTVFDEDGGEVTFNPRKPGRPKRVVVDPRSTPQQGVCPMLTECVLVDNLGREVTFSPSAATGSAPVTLDSASGALLSVSCPTTTECTAINEFEQVLTFNPQAPGVTKPIDIDHTPSGQATALTSISCPSAMECVVGDVQGRELTFNPQSIGAPTPSPVVNGDPLYALNCVSSTNCLALDKGSIVAFDPTQPSHNTSTVMTKSQFNLGEIACPSEVQCSVINRPYGEFTIDASAPHAVRSATVSTGRQPRRH